MKTLILQERDKRAVKKAVDILRRKGVIIYPTETQYGIGTDATNRTAVKKVFAVKKRPVDKKMILAFSDLAMTKKYFTLGKEEEKLVKRLMPGPFTLVINSEAFRIPDNAVARKIIRKFGKPITTTSANISGEAPPTKISEIIGVFNGKVDLIIDGGDLKAFRHSTIFRWEDRKILRCGPVSRKEIMKTLRA